MILSHLLEEMQHLDFWIIIGFMGQALFTARFLVQWLASEKVKKSIVPNMFWWFSVGGGIVLLIYALHRADPVFIAGQAAGLVIYSRNIFLIYKKTHTPPLSTTESAIRTTPPT